MNDTDKFKLEFTGVYLQMPNCALLSSEAEELAEEQVDHSYVYMHFNDKWYIIEQWPNAVVSMCHTGVTPAQLFFLCANGKVYRRYKSVITEELIDPSDEGPSDLLLMRRIIAVGDELVAVGMARRAYKRSSAGAWAAIDASCFVRRKDRTSATGFNDVVSFRAGLLAAGYKGEIWIYDGSTWTQDTSPTNVTLTCMASEPDGSAVVIAGLGGLVLSGLPGAWRVLTQNVTAGDFWGAVAFDGRVYLSNGDGVFKVDGNQLQRVSIDAQTKPSTGFLASRDSCIWSVGARDLYRSTDAVTWTRLPFP